MVKVSSSQLTFIDQTDSRKFEIHISSNLPQVQTYDKNTGVYTPNWSSTPLNLQASIYLDSTDITANIKDSDVEWYKNTISTATKISNGKTLIINTNVLSTEPIITYICQAKYQNLTTGTRIDYTRIDSGVNGTNGASAPAVQAQYSVDGSAWTATLNASAHKYVRYSYDGGKTWTTAIKMAGEDGTSVKIIGTAYTPDDLTEGEVVRLYSDSNNSTLISTDNLSTGDSYLVSGYLCVYNADNDNFICAGTIQGPAGNDGESSYVFIRYATDASGTGMSTSPSGKTYIGVYTSNTNTQQPPASAYTWSKFVGDSAKSIILSGDSQVFKVSQSSVYTPTTIKVTAQTINTSVTTWTYSTDGGQTFVSTAPTGVVRSGNVVTITGTTLATNSVVIKASDGSIGDVFTVYKAFDGTNGAQGATGQSASMTFLTNENVTFSANASGQITATAITTNVVAYTGITKATPTIGTISGLPAGMTATVGTAVNNEVPIVFTIENNATLGSASSNNGSITIPVNGPVYTNLILSWSKVNSGVAGTSASLVDITPSALYFKSTTGKDGEFTPDYIYLYPRFQNATFSKWQYSSDGGVTWADLPASSGVSVGTYNSVPSSLRISRTSVLYTDVITSISFRCNTADSTVYDVVSIAKIYDVVDLQIGGRNLLLNSGTPLVLSTNNSTNFPVKTELITEGTKLFRRITRTNIESYPNTMSLVNAIAWNMLTDEIRGKTVTMSFAARASQEVNFSLFASGYAPAVQFDNNPGPITIGTEWKRYTMTTTIPTEISAGIRFGPYLTNNITDISTFYLDVCEWQIEFGNVATDYSPAHEDLLNSAANINVMLSNEAHFFEANATGIPTATSIVLEVIGYKGSIRSSTTVGAIGGLPSAGMTATISDNNTTSTKITIAVTTALTSAIADYGTLTIPVTVNGNTINKIFSWSKAKAGTPGTAASLVTITPSALYFKSTTGKGGVFTPEYIYLYPKFQNVFYRSWQYSIDGGITWIATTGVNGLSIVTRDGIGNVLRVSRTSTLYTDEVTSISFRCNSSDTTVYDVVSIAKIYDVVDLVIGGNNLARFTNSEYWSSYITASVSFSDGTRSKRIKAVCNATDTSTSARFGIQQSTEARLMKLQSGKEYTLSFLVRGNVSNLRYVYLMNPGSTNLSIGDMSAPTLSETNFVKVSKTFTASSVVDTSTGSYIMISYSGAKDPSLWFEIEEVQLEAGNKATDWSPAFEDVEANIEKVDTRLTDSLVEIKTTTDSITSRVSSTEETIKTVSGNVTSLTTRVSSAEEKITDDAIVSTVRQSTDYTNDLGQKVGTNEIISKINQTAESVTISASKIGLLGATNIPDLTADKIKGGTLTLGGSSATTQNGQLLVKNASDVDMVKLNKDGIVVKSGHLAVAEDFQNSRYNWEDDSWTTTTNTRQLDLASDYLRMGIYTASGYSPDMVLSDTGLSFQGVAQGVGSWGSFIGHHWDQLDFVIQDTVRSNISFRGYGDAELANISGDGFYINGPISGGITSGNAKQFSNVFVKNFSSQHTGYIAIRLGTITRAANSMITIKGHVTSYQNSSSFEASCYFYNTTSSFFGTIATMSNPDVLKEVYFAEGVSDGCVYLIIGGSDSTWSYPTVAIDTLTVGYTGHTAYEWNSGWDATLYSNLSSFKTVTACARGGMKKTLWSGAIQAGATISLAENLRNFKFLTCIIGDSTTPYGIVLVSLLDDEIAELHFFGFVTNSYAASEHYGARFTINNQTSLRLLACGTSANNTLYCRKIVGWR